VNPEMLAKRLRQIYSENCVPDFIRIARVLWRMLQRTFWFLCIWIHCAHRRRVWHHRLVRLDCDSFM